MGLTWREAGGCLCWLPGQRPLPVASRGGSCPLVLWHWRVCASVGRKRWQRIPYQAGGSRDTCRGVPSAPGLTQPSHSLRAAGTGQVTGPRVRQPQCQGPVCMSHDPGARLLLGVPPAYRRGAPLQGGASWSRPTSPARRGPKVHAPAFDLHPKPRMFELHTASSL